jgi:type I restriction enzyme S subunit
MSAIWELAPLRELLEVQNGYAFDAKKFTAENGVPLIRIRDLKEGDGTETNYTGQFDRDYLVNGGDLLIGMDGEFRCHEWKGPPSLLNQRVCRLRNFNGNLEPRFLYYGINKYLEEIEDATSYTTVKHLSSKTILGIEFPHPPLPEQQRIVGKLDAAFATLTEAQAHVERNRANARELFESYLNGVFEGKSNTWLSADLQSVTNKIGSGATPRGGEAEYKKTGIPLIRSLNVHDFGFRYERLAFLDDAQAEDLSNVVVREGDVLLNITGASVARSTVVPLDVLPARVNQHVAIIRPMPEKLDSRFLHFMLVSKTYKERLLQTGEEGGSTRQAITKAQLEQFRVTYPATLGEQTALANQLSEVLLETQSLETTYQRKLSVLAGLKKAVLGAAFRGEL